MWRSKRHTNPLNPTYQIWDESLGEFGRKLESASLNKEYGEIAGARPAGLPKAKSDVRNLSTQDIEGAQSNTRSKGAFTWMERRQVRELNKTDDI